MRVEVVQRRTQRNQLLLFTKVPQCRRRKLDTVARRVAEVQRPTTLWPLYLRQRERVDNPP